MKDQNRYALAFSEGEDYAAFTSEKLHGEDREYLEKMNHYYSTCVLDDETKKRIELLPDDIKLLVIAERWCPDSIINLPALMIMVEQNPKIQLKIVSRTGHEDLLDEVDSKDKTWLPTVLVIKNEVVVGRFVERPSVVTHAEHGEDQVRKISVMKAYREGQYMVETMCDILDLLNA